MADPMDCPHNIHHKPTSIMVKVCQFGHPHWENNMAHNYAHGPSMFDHPVPPTTILWTVRPFEHSK